MSLINLLFQLRSTYFEITFHSYGLAKYLY